MADETQVPAQPSSEVTSPNPVDTAPAVPQVPAQPADAPPVTPADENTPDSPQATRLGRPRIPSLEEVKDAGYTDEAAPKIVARQKRLQELFDGGKSIEEANAIVQAEINDLHDSVGTPKTDGDGEVLGEAPAVGPRGANVYPDSLSEEQRKQAPPKVGYPNTTTDLVDSIGAPQEEQHFGPRGATAPRDTFRS
jgi:hypothetical protein